MFGYQFALGGTAQPTSFGIHNNSASAMATNLRMALYDTNGALPGTRVAHTASSPVLPPGMTVSLPIVWDAAGTCPANGQYWVMVLADSALDLGQSPSTTNNTLSLAGSDFPMTWTGGTVASAPQTNLWLNVLEP
jgi:hypothetical protein